METPELADIVRSLGCPVVDVRGSVPDCGLPLIATENKMVVNHVAEHFMQRGFRHYAFCGFVGANYSDQRSQMLEDGWLKQVLPAPLTTRRKRPVTHR